MEVRPSSQFKRSRLTVLPPELVVRCLEFLPFGEVHAEAKQVSKGMRAAARRALTRGRWRPVRLVMERSPLTWGRAVTSPEAFRAAWEIEPKLAFLELADWDRGVWPLDLEHRPPGSSYEDDQTARLLWLVEPTIDGLERIVAACEPAHKLIHTGWAHDPRYAVVAKHQSGGIHLFGGGPRTPRSIIKGWSWWVGCPITGVRNFPPPFELSSVLPELSSGRNFDYDASPLIGAALESWADPEFAVSFLDDLMNYALDPSVTVHRRVSATWRDRSKADAFVAYALECQDEYDQHPHGDY